MNFKGGYQSVDSYGGGGGGGGYGGGYGGGGGGGYGGGGGGYGGGGGGGGYGGGGGGYGGGGFIQNSQGFSSPGMSPSVGGKGKPRNQSVIPLTSAQIMSAEEVTEGTFKTSGKEIGMVCVVGEIMEAQISPTHVVYQVDDRTGPWVKVQKWMSDQDSGDQAASCQEGMYVKAVGHLKVFNNQRSVTAFLIKPISDFNEVTHHLAEVMACHLMATKEMPVPEQFKKSVTGGGGGSWGTPMATSTQMTPMRGGGGMGGGYAGAQQTDDGLTSLQQQVLNTISSCQDQHGININLLIRNMSQRGQNEKNIKMAVEFLCNEGHIYSTIDDDHYKSING